MATWAQERAKIRAMLNDEQVAEAFIDTPALDRVMNDLLRELSEMVGLGEIVFQTLFASSNGNEQALSALFDYAQGIAVTLDRTNQPLRSETEAWMRAMRSGVPTPTGDPEAFAFVRRLPDTTFLTKTASEQWYLMLYPAPLQDETITIRFRSLSADLAGANVVPASLRVCDLWRANVARRVALRMSDEQLTAHRLSPKLIDEWKAFVDRGVVEARIRMDTGKRASRVKLGSMRAWRT